MATDYFKGIKQQLRVAVGHAVTATAQNIYEHAEEHAPVREIFKHGGRKARVRRQTKAEALGEVSVRQQLFPTRASQIARRPARVLTADSRRSRANLFDPDLSRTAPGFMARREAAIRAYSEGKAVEIPNARRLSRFKTGGLKLENADVTEALSRHGRSEMRLGRAVSRHRLEYGPARKGDPPTLLRRPLERPTLGGTLKHEIHLEPLQIRENIVKRRVVSPTAYAKYVEFGTRRSKAQPYLRPAVAAFREFFQEAVRKQIGKAQTEIRQRGGRGFESGPASTVTAATLGLTQRHPPKPKQWVRRTQKVSAADIDRLAQVVRKHGGGMV